MEEIRLSYLCTQASLGRLTLEELSELLGWIALDPEILELILIESILRGQKLR